jgi:catechol 2,3-dioxygenase-like lactoylglutathione lyase family enzyme
MLDPTPTIVAGFVQAFGDYRRRVHQLAEGLSETQFWARPYPYGNSLGHLTLHLTGNLNFYVGRHMAGTDYVRDRDREFHDPDPPSKDEALRRLDAAVDLVLSLIRRQTANDWAASFAAAGAEDVHDRFSMLLRAAAHFHHHVGQMVYLVKEHGRVAAGAEATVGPRYAHTNLVARDWRALGRFYEETLGCVPLAPERDLAGDWLDRGTGISGARITGAHYRLPGAGIAGPTIEIFQYEPREEAPLPRVNRPGFGHIAFTVPDVAIARAAVLAAGGQALGTVESVDIPGAGRITWTYVRDPEGNIIELQRRSRPA